MHVCIFISMYLCIYACMYVCMVLRTCSLPCLALFSSILIYFCPRISLSRLSNYSGQQLDMKENSNTSRERFVADQAMTAEDKSYHKSSKRATRPDTHNADGSFSRRLCLLEHFAFASTALRVFGRVVWSVIQAPDGTLATHPLRLQKKMSTKSFAHHLALSWCRETKMLSLQLGPSILAPAAFLFHLAFSKQLPPWLYPAGGRTDVFPSRLLAVAASSPANLMSVRRVRPASHGPFSGLATSVTGRTSIVATTATTVARGSLSCRL